MTTTNLPQLIDRIQLRISSRKMIELLLEQLNKDLQRAALPEILLDTNNHLDWFVKLENYLSTLNTTEINHLHYLIDLPEGVHNQNDEGYFYNLAETILFRELSKVYFKLQYK